MRHTRQRHIQAENIHHVEETALFQLPSRILPEPSSYGPGGAEVLHGPGEAAGAEEDPGHDTGL